jgi:hypothetical protein
MSRISLSKNVLREISYTHSSLPTGLNTNTKRIILKLSYYLVCGAGRGGREGEVGKEARRREHERMREISLCISHPWEICTRFNFIHLFVSHFKLGNLFTLNKIREGHLPTYTIRRGFFGGRGSAFWDRVSL